MKQFRVTLSIVLVCAGFFFCAWSPVADQPGSSVWKVSKDGNTLFLGGSIHILREADFPLPAGYDSAFSQSAILVLETDVEKMAEPEIVQYLMSRMILSGNTTLQSILDPDIYKMLEKECSKYGLSLNTFSKLKPSMVITILSMVQIQKYGFTQQGIDMYYLDMAKKENKPVHFLETVQTQIDALAGMGEGYENDYVRYSLNDMENTETEIEVLLAEWKNGNPSKSEAILSEMEEEWPLIYKTLVGDRNNAWIPQIKKFLASGQVYFVIAGLLHLHGKDGLLRQLKDSGCTIEQLK
ncbi:MAG: TraB/GumN family protein [Treponema sp.]|nr:TraB/GumN family protein [Treponema sp.]